MTTPRACGTNPYIEAQTSLLSQRPGVLRVTDIVTVINFRHFSVSSPKRENAKRKHTHICTHLRSWSSCSTLIWSRCSVRRVLSAPPARFCASAALVFSVCRSFRVFSRSPSSLRRRRSWENGKQNNTQDGRIAKGAGAQGGGTHLLLALVIWPLTTRPFRDGGRENEQRVGCWRFRVWTGGGGCFVFLDAVALSLSLVVASG